MAVVDAFGTLANTINAGLTAYFRATGCTSITIADVLPLFSKITTYADEYVIGEMKIWDTGSEGIEPNNCAMVRVIVYNDGWICAWFDKESVNQGSTGGCTFYDAQTLAGFGTFCEYPDKWNGCYLKVTNSNGTGADDSECPDDTIFCIRDTDSINGRIKVRKLQSGYHFNTGNTYDVEIYMTSGNLVWWGHTSNSVSSPSNLSNRLYRAITEMWGTLRFSSNATNTTNTAATRVSLDDDGSFTNYTTAFNNATVNDVQLIPTVEEVDDAFYFGYSYKFKGLTLNIGTAGVGNTIVWEYYNGSAWTSLSVTDTTSGFTVAGTNTVTFTPPDDWSKTSVNAYEYFWIRSRVSVAAFTTQPLLTQGWIIVPNSITYLNTNLGMYSFEDTSANYCLICGDTLGASAYNTIGEDYFYNTSLLGKTIYKHSISHGGYLAGSGAVGYIYINTKLYYSLSVQGSTNGYEIIDITDIDGAAGIQNVYRAYFNTGYNTPYTVYQNLATVLITS